MKKPKNLAVRLYISFVAGATITGFFSDFFSTIFIKNSILVMISHLLVFLTIAGIFFLLSGKLEFYPNNHKYEDGYLISDINDIRNPLSKYIVASIHHDRNLDPAYRHYDD